MEIFVGSAGRPNCYRTIPSAWIFPKILQIPFTKLRNPFLTRGSPPISFTCLIPSLFTPAHRYGQVHPPSAFADRKRREHPAPFCFSWLPMPVLPPCRSPRHSFYSEPKQSFCPRSHASYHPACRESPLWGRSSHSLSSPRSPCWAPRKEWKSFSGFLFPRWRWLPFQGSGRLSYKGRT